MRNFIEQNKKEQERVLKLDLSDSNMKNAYDGQALKISEWERGSSDLDVCIQNKKSQSELFLLQFYPADLSRIRIQLLPNKVFPEKPSLFFPCISCCPLQSMNF